MSIKAVSYCKKNASQLSSQPGKPGSIGASSAKYTCYLLLKSMQCGWFNFYDITILIKVQAIQA
jgi:hypothetical protein